MTKCFFVFKNKIKHFWHILLRRAYFAKNIFARLIKHFKSVLNAYIKVFWLGT